jgi:hypothetical protein
VVFEGPFDELVQKVRGDQLVDVRTREVHREWLEVGEHEWRCMSCASSHLHIRYDTILRPEVVRVEQSEEQLGVFARA